MALENVQEDEKLFELLNQENVLYAINLPGFRFIFHATNPQILRVKENVNLIFILVMIFILKIEILINVAPTLVFDGKYSVLLFSFSD